MTDDRAAVLADCMESLLQYLAPDTMGQIYLELQDYPSDPEAVALQHAIEDFVAHDLLEDEIRRYLEVVQ